MVIGALGWLSEHQDDPDIDQPYMVKKSDTIPKTPLTEEEKAQRLLAIKDRVKQRRADREKQDKAEELRREKERRERGTHSHTYIQHTYIHSYGLALVMFDKPRMNRSED